MTDLAGAVNKAGCKRASMKAKKDPLRYWKVVEKGKDPVLVDYTHLSEIDGLKTLNGIIQNTN